MYAYRFSKHWPESLDFKLYGRDTFENPMRKPILIKGINQNADACQQQIAK